MKKTVFTGAGVAIVTPMHEDGTVNYDVFSQLLEDQIASGTDAIIACGTTGESATLSHQEHVEVLDFAIRRVNKRVPVIAGTGSNDTAYALELSLEAQKAGADALLMVTPSRTGCNIKPETFLELSKHPNIVAVKEASGDISAVAEIAALCGDDLQLYSGNDDQILPVLALGGKGVISVLSNVLPRETHEICELFFRGDVEGSRCMMLKYLDLIHALFSDVNPIPVKEAMNLMGMQVGPCRLPLVEMSENGKKNLVEVLKKYSLV